MAEFGKNPISLLKEYYDRLTKTEKALGEPKYDCAIHALFGFRAECTYRDKTTEGTGKSKKEAKYDAARKMLIILKQPVPPLDANASISSSKNASKTTNSVRSLPERPKYTSSPETEDKAAAFMKKYSNQTPFTSCYPPPSEHLEVCFNDINFGMKSPNSPKSQILIHGSDRYKHPIDCFERVMLEFGFKFCAEQVEVNAEAGDIYVVLLKIDFHYMVVGGRGESLGEAVEKACQNGIDTFRLYMK